jgi:[ribosomal protein S5]-alanine N-acetyltransferase
LRKDKASEFCLETTNLLLNKISLDDAEFMLELVNSPGWLQYIGDRKVYSIEDAEKYLEAGILKCYQEHGFGFWLVKDKASLQKIGLCGFTKRDFLDSPDVGFAFLPNWISKGYGYESASVCLKYALEILKLPKIEAIVNPENVVSNKLLKKIGMKFEKMIRLQEENKEVNLYAIINYSTEKA